MSHILIFLCLMCSFLYGEDATKADSENEQPASEEPIKASFIGKAKMKFSLPASGGALSVVWMDRGRESIVGEVETEKGELGSQVVA